MNKYTLLLPFVDEFGWSDTSREHQINQLNFDIMKTFEERFFEMAENLAEHELVTLYNEFATNCGYEEIFTTDEFNEICAGFDPLDVALKVRHGSFNPSCDYWTFDGYANFESIENVREYLDDYYLADLCDWYEQNERTLRDLFSDEWDATEDEDEEPEDEE